MSGDLAGASLGPYSILDLLGAGGMGEVWRAEDTRLGRQVALKMLPEAVATDPERMGCFEREAKVLGSLNHSNIATLYGLEQLPLSAPPGRPPSGADAGRPTELSVLVMELVEGEGLDELTARGPLPFHETISIALQISEALQAAHERGIVHRDLKPANIKVRPDGLVKVLDFGLATTWQTAPRSGSLSIDPTMSGRGSNDGALVGTASYMAPEQARGRPVDRRADIWGFGCLLYEMLTGRRAFPGDTLSDTLATVLKDDPDWRALPSDIDAVARHVLRRCLAKDPERRFHDIADVRIELEEAVATAPPRGLRRRRRRWRRIGVQVAVGMMAVALAVTATLLAARSSASLPSFRALTFHAGRVTSARFGPDRETVLFGMATRSSPLSIHSTRGDSVESRPLDLPPADVLGISRTGRMAILLDRHTEGSWVSVGTLAVAALAGGAPRLVLERVNDGDISADGERIAVAREVGMTQRLEYPIGRELFRTTGWISDVRIAPDGERVAFLHHPHYGDDRGLVMMIDADGAPRELIPEMPDSVQGLAWSPDGSSIWYSAFVFGEGGVIWSVEPGEAPVERLRAPVNMRLEDLAADGRALIVAGDSSAEIAGKLTGDVSERRYEGWNDDSIGGVAADGTMFAGNLQVATVDGEYGAFVRRAGEPSPVRIGVGNVFGVSPEGDWVYTHRMSGERSRITLLPAGPGAPRNVDLGGVVPSSSGAAMLTSSSDGRRVAFIGLTVDGPARAHVLEPESGRLVAVGPNDARSAVISPDGTRVAIVAADRRVVVYPVSGESGRVAKAALPGEEPIQWSRDGRALLVWDRSFPARIHRLGLDDGSRELALEIMPEDPAGVLYGHILLAPGGEHYMYRYRRDLGRLMLVQGAS